MRTLSDQARTPVARDAGTPLATATLSELEINLQPADILRSLGYPPEASPPSHVVQSVEEFMREAGAFLQPCGAYSLYAPTAWTAGSLDIGGCTIVGDVGEILHGARRVAVFMVTAGSEITRQAGMRRDAGDAFAGRVLDTIGSWAAELAADVLMAQLASHLGPEESFTARYSPGFCGMELSQQRVLFRLAPAGAVGISLLPSLFMHPLKSISGLVGLGPRAVVGVHLSPCERCPQAGCHLRR
jgi:hypothetical protein